MHKRRVRCLLLALVFSLAATSGDPTIQMNNIHVLCVCTVA